MSDSKHVIKEGELILKSSGILNKKHKRWCQLIRLPDGVACLEACESQDQKEKVKNSFQLIQVKGIDKIVKESTKEFYIDVHTKKDKFSLLLSNIPETEQWYACLQDNSRFIEGREDSSSTAFDDGDDDGLKDNILYDSQGPEETVRIDVMLKDNEDVRKLNLDINKTYKLHVTSVCMMLEEKDVQEPRYKWYYEHLRKYGKGKGEFTIISGRKSDSGVATLVFINDNPAQISRAIDKLTKRKHEEQLTTKFESRGYNEASDQNAMNRLSEPLSQRENSPIPARQALSLKEGNSRPTVIARQNSANLSHIPTDFKHELEDCVKSKTMNEKTKQSKKEKSENKDEKKKMGFTFFKKDKSDKKTKDKNDQENNKGGAYPREHLYDEPEQLMKPVEPTEPLYEEADQNILRAKNMTEKQAIHPPAQQQNLYAQAHTARNQAWKVQGQEDEYHLEQYEGIKAARQNCVSHDIKHDVDDDIDDTYDHAFLSDTKKALAKKLTESKNVYGITSGTEEPDYDDEPVEYDDAVSTQLRCSQHSAQQIDAYEEVDLHG